MDGSTGDRRTGAPDRGVDELIARIERLDDDERAVLADARSRALEAEHADSLDAAFGILAGRGEEYFRVRGRVARAHLPSILENDVEPPVGEVAEHANYVARLAQQAIDDALIALLTRDRLHPDHLRELYRSFAELDRVTAERR